MSAYYNEYDPKAAAWLRELIREGLIAHGEVDTRSIEDVTPDDLRGFTQCHFFAGIGVWSYALRRAGWPDDVPVWTGSCPCQPFSAAGKGGGFDDERHLWPAFLHLIRVGRPGRIFGEQVASKDGLAWLDLVQADLEGEDYAVGAVDTCAAGFGAPHIRQRLYWVADASEQGWGSRGRHGETRDGRGPPRVEPGRLRDAGRLAQPDGGQRDRLADGQGRLGDGAPAGWVEGDGLATPGGRPVGLEHTDGRGEGEGEGEGSRDHRQAGQEAPGDVRADDRAALRLRAGSVSGLADDDDQRRDRVEAARLRGRRNAQGGTEPAEGRADGAPGHDPDRRGELGRLEDSNGPVAAEPARERRGPGEAARTGPDAQSDRRSELAEGQPSAGPTNGLWQAADWLLCRDEKWRPVEPGTFPLADAGTFRNRVAELRGAGNAVNLAQAQGFIEAYIDAERRVRLTSVSGMTHDSLDIFA